VDASIKCLPVFLPTLDFSTVKNDVFPPIASTFSKTSSLAIKVRSLEAFSVLCGGSANESDGLDDLSGAVQSSKPAKSSILDKYTIQEKLVPSLKAIKTKEPSVMMAAIKVFREVGKIADTEFLALEVLPILWSFSLGPLLNLNQFNEFMALIKFLSGKIEREQARKLQELSSNGDSSGFQNRANGFSQSDTDLTSTDMDNAKNNFERLVLGNKGASSSTGKESDIWGSMEPEPASKRPSMSPAFSWSTNNNHSGHSVSSPMGIRSITPDQKLNTIPSLEPARQTSPPTSHSPLPFMQPMQPMQPSQTWNVQAPASNKPGSLSSLSGLSTAKPLSQSTLQQGPNYSAFSIPPPPASSAMNTTNAFTSPSINTNLSMSMTPQAPSRQQPQPQQQQQQQQQSGLDKYASLL